MNPIHEYQHDAEKLKTKSHHAHGRNYKLKLSVPQIRPEQEVLEDLSTLPSSVDHRDKSYMPTPLDQGSLGSCGANAMANALSFVNGKEGLPTFHPSRLALYYECRVFVEHQLPDVDSGVTLADMCRTVRAFHACPEEDWPYDISKFMLPPPKKAMLDALLHARFQAVSVPQRLSTIKSMLAAGYPIVFGIQVFPSFESQAVAETGIVPLPDTSKESSIGGHALGCYGYSDAKQAFLVINSWGPYWGQSGLCWMPYQYILNRQICSDLWCVKAI
jgi:C1A family cysteine protease